MAKSAKQTHSREHGMLRGERKVRTMVEQLIRNWEFALGLSVKGIQRC